MTTQAETGARKGGWLKGLKRCEAGNVLPMAAMALVPIAGMIGSGLDMSRAYLAKAKLQTACDATALATRRYMGGNAFSVDTSPADGKPDAKAEGEKFFNFNFPTGFMGTTSRTVNIGVNATNTDVVEVTASTSVRTAVMKIFGKQTIPISVSCNADQDFVNNDIMLVLDVTASMNCAAGTGSSCSFQASEQANSRLSRLRGAAASLYRALATADSGVRMRYGFMPYSMTVNVGGSLPNVNMVRSPATYHNCTNQSTSGTRTCNTWGTMVSANRPTTVTCLEERSSWDQRTAANITISTAVSDDDINTTSTTDNNLKWPAYNTTSTVGETNSVSTDSTYNSLTSFCPAAASRLATVANETAFQNRLNAAIAQVGGYTNHDLGITWGMRFLSSNGMFSSDNPQVLNSMRVDKHLIFLTDGEMTAESHNYSAFGIPSARDRMTGTGSLVEKHKARFLNACNRARQLGATVWVIALDVGATGDISPCASGSDRFFVSNGSNLANVFDTIGKEIGKLRLTK